jgi:transposase
MEVTTLRCHVNVWGVVWDHGSIFVQFDGHLSSDAFIELLKAHLLPEKENLAGRVLLIDQHPAHRSKSAKAWLTAQGFNHVMLPTHSPQFNAIEECWSWMKRYVRKLRPTTESELRLFIQEAGEVLPLEVIQAHLEHAQSNIRVCAYKEEGEE